MKEAKVSLESLIAKPAVIKVILKKSLLERTQEFCDELFAAMKVETTVNIDFREEDNVMNIDLSGSDMGILIGKRGQTLDALQYLDQPLCES